MKQAWWLCFLVVPFLSAGCGAGADRPGYRVWPADMHESVSYSPFEPNLIAPEGQPRMLPPGGTIPYEKTGGGQEVAVPGGIRAGNVVQAAESHLERGKQLYATFCVVCHGESGAGDGPVSGPFPKPPSLIGESTRIEPDAQLYHFITYGRNLMPSFGAQVQASDRWNLVYYIRKLDKSRM